MSTEYDDPTLWDDAPFEGEKLVWTSKGGTDRPVARKGSDWYEIYVRDDANNRYAWAGANESEWEVCVGHLQWKTRQPNFSPGQVCDTFTPEQIAFLKENGIELPRLRVNATLTFSVPVEYAEDFPFFPELDREEYEEDLRNRIARLVRLFATSAVEVDLDARKITWELQA